MTSKLHESRSEQIEIVCASEAALRMMQNKSKCEIQVLAELVGGRNAKENNRAKRNAITSEKTEKIMSTVALRSHDFGMGLRTVEP